METAQVLVTGATGFIGRYLFQQLRKQGYRPLGLSKNGGTVGDVAIAAVDITEGAAVQEFFGSHPVEVVFHLACYIPRIETENIFLECWRVNAIGTRNLVRAAAECGVKRFIYTSSQTVCNGAGRTHVKEDFTAPNSAYGVSKLAGEQLCRIYAPAAMGLIILRYSSVYGFGELPATVAPRFIEQLIRRQPLIVRGDGASTYDFIYVKDAVAATLRAGLSEAVGIFNVGSGEPTSVKTLAETLGKLYPEARISYDATTPDPGRNFCFAMEKTRKTFGFIPRYRLTDGLREYLNEIREVTCINQ